MRVLLAEDNRKLAEFMARGLRENGCAVDVAHNGLDAEHLGRTEAYDVIVLDIMLPEQSGYEVIRKLRSAGSSVPIIFVTARDAIDDRVTGLDSGADDYLVKPFHFPELLARLRALHRRSPDMAPMLLRCGTLTLDPSTHKVLRDGKAIDLTPKEFSLLEYLLRHAGSVVTRTAIIENVWDMNFESLTNVVDVFVNHLRSKIDRPFKTKLLHTVRGVGYIMNPGEESS